MRRYLAVLPPPQRAVLVLRYYDDLSEAQIAEIMRCPPGTVKSRAASGIETLRRLMETSYADGPAAAEGSEPRG